MNFRLGLCLLLLVMGGCGTTTSTVKQGSKTQNIAESKFGFEVAPLGEQQKAQTGLSHGVLITQVYSFYPANKAGILKGDILVNLDKHTILDYETFQKLLNDYRFIYGQVTLGISRNNQIQKINLYLN